MELPKNADAASQPEAERDDAWYAQQLADERASDPCSVEPDEPYELPPPDDDAPARPARAEVIRGERRF